MKFNNIILVKNNYIIILLLFLHLNYLHLIHYYLQLSDIFLIIHNLILLILMLLAVKNYYNLCLIIKLLFHLQVHVLVNYQSKNNHMFY
jgi:hypothetical protein